MSATESTLFPCPQCGTARGEIGNPCPKCSWIPDATPISNAPTSVPYGKFAAIVIGALTILPFAYLFLFFAFIVVSVLSPEFMQNTFVLLFVAHIAVIILTWCLVAFYVYFLFKTDQIKQDQKVLWAAVLFLGNLLAMPVFWYLYIWKPASETR